MKFNLNDFMQLDTKALLAVNGGTHCGGETDSSGYASSSGSNSYGTRGGGGSSGGGSSGGGSGGGGCSRFDLTPFINSTKETSWPETSASTSSGGGSCGGATRSESNNVLVHQNSNNPDDYHCDINSYNVAVDEGIKNPGSWDGNKMTVNEIYTSYYSHSSTDKPQAGTRGYGFYDNDGDGTYDHMYYYDYSKGGSTYHVWNSDGKAPVTEHDWSINGTAVGHSVYVPLD